MIYKEIRNYTISWAPPLPQKYFNFVEKSQEELDKVTFFSLKYWDFMVWYTYLVYLWDEAQWPR